MPGTTTNAQATGVDDLDDLFNYDVDPDHASYNPQRSPDAPAPGQSPSRAKPADLGIDEEIQVAKKRKPIAKLDENRLLSQAGIPKLRRIAKERLKFKGKGHEYSDVARLLNLYQFWLDDLYPRAKFADGLTMIEKLGHSKRLQTMRREWIREGRPVERNDEDAVQPAEPARETVDVEPGSSGTLLGNRNAAEGAGDSGSSGEDSTIMESVKGKIGNEDSLFVSADEADEQPEEDELDALLAEDAFGGAPTAAPLVPAPGRRDEFEDEMEAMAEMEGMW
ncbi:chromosome segregation in meiosis- protein [Lambiella insularis]|nr:chromosome segregation in meiosis- protein [Lambiella insularis]